MTSSPRTRASRTGLLVVGFAILLAAALADLARDRSLLRAVFAPDASETPAEGLVRGVRDGLARPPR